jgi:Domain of unknown function (DUF4345)
MFKIVLRILGIACVLAGLTHAHLGASGDWIIGVLPAQPVDPSLDSQNRFYGAAFMIYGFLLWICSDDLPRFAPVLRTLFGAMFIAGCARGLAVFHYGWPTPQILFLWTTELSAPLFWIWLNRILSKKQGRRLNG